MLPPGAGGTELYRLLVGRWTVEDTKEETPEALLCAGEETVAVLLVLLDGLSELELSVSGVAGGLSVCDILPLDMEGGRMLEDEDTSVDIETRLLPESEGAGSALDMIGVPSSCVVESLTNEEGGGSDGLVDVPGVSVIAMLPPSLVSTVEALNSVDCSV